MTSSYQVSGGTGFAIIEVSDPMVTTCGTGIELRSRFDPLPASHVRLRIQGATAKINEVRYVKARIPATARIQEAAPNATAPGAVQEFKEIQLSIPRQTVDPVNVDLTLPLDREALLQVGAEEDQDVIILVGRVRALR